MHLEGRLYSKKESNLTQPSMDYNYTQEKHTVPKMHLFICMLLCNYNAADKLNTGLDHTVCIAEFILAVNSNDSSEI